MYFLCVRPARAPPADAELIFDAETFVRNLPLSIEAVFFMRHSEAQERWCNMALSGSKCEEYTRAAWLNMRRHFGRTAQQLPLLRFDPFNLKTPFHAVAPPDPRP